MIRPAMWAKAQELIGQDARASWRAANVTRRGKTRRRHVPYVLPARAAALVEALGSGDPERVSGLILGWEDLPRA